MCFLPLRSKSAFCPCAIRLGHEPLSSLMRLGGGEKTLQGSGSHYGPGPWLPKPFPSSTPRSSSCWQESVYKHVLVLNL